jgi:hypothetical protein
VREIAGQEVRARADAVPTFNNMSQVFKNVAK